MSNLSQSEKDSLLLEAVNSANILEIKKLIGIGANVNAQFCLRDVSSGYWCATTLLGFLIERAYLTCQNITFFYYCDYYCIFQVKTITCYSIRHQLLELVNCLIELGASTKVTLLTCRRWNDYEEKMTFLERVSGFLMEESKRFLSYSSKFSRTQLCYDLFFALLQKETCDPGTLHDNKLVNEVCNFYLKTKMSDQYEHVIVTLCYNMLMFGYELPSIHIIDQVRRKSFSRGKKDFEIFKRKANKIKQLFQLKDYTTNLYFGNMTFAKFVWLIYCMEQKTFIYAIEICSCCFYNYSKKLLTCLLLKQYSSKYVSISFKALIILIISLLSSCLFLKNLWTTGNENLSCHLYSFCKIVIEHHIVVIGSISSKISSAV